jgi:hypothetical protein
MTLRRKLWLTSGILAVLALGWLSRPLDDCVAFGQLHQLGDERMMLGPIPVRKLSFCDDYHAVLSSLDRTEGPMRIHPVRGMMVLPGIVLSNGYRARIEVFKRPMPATDARTTLYILNPPPESFFPRSWALIKRRLGFVSRTGI